MPDNFPKSEQAKSRFIFIAVAYTILIWLVLAYGTLMAMGHGESVAFEIAYVALLPLSAVVHLLLYAISLTGLIADNSLVGAALLAPIFIGGPLVNALFGKFGIRTIRRRWFGRFGR